MITIEILNRARQSLAERAERLRVVARGQVVSRDFPLIDFNEDGFGRGEISKWANTVADDENNCPVIYRISAVEAVSRDLCLRSFDALDQPANFAMARSNIAHRAPENNILYVGSSHNIGSRIKQHLEWAPIRTYALHMCRWCRGNAGSIRVELQSLGIPAFDKTVQDIEDTLWDASRPLFGKRGGR